MSHYIDHNAHLPATFLPTADAVMVYLDGEPLVVRRYAQFDVPLYTVHASLTDEAEHEIRLVIKRKFRSLNLLPKHHGVEFDYPADMPEAKKQKNLPSMFRFRGNKNFVIECEAIGYLCLCFDPLQETPSGPTVLNAMDCGITSDADTVQTAALQRAIDQVSNSDTLQTLLLPAGTYRSGDLQLRSDCRLHLASGAVIKASDNPDDLGDPNLRGAHPNRATFISARNAENIAITGHGHLDGNRAVLDAAGYYKSMCVLIGCKDITIDGPVFSDSCGWSTCPYNCEDVSIKRLKIFNNRPVLKCLNTDGVNPDCSRRVTIEDCVFHTGDDAVAVKTSQKGDQPAADCTDITVRDLLAINNSATAKIGTETMGARMERIHFERITAVRTVRLIALDVYDVAAIRDVSWTDIYAHEIIDEAGLTEPFVIDLFAPAGDESFSPTCRQIDGSRHQYS